MVETVLGPIEAEGLQGTLVHEHLYFSYPGDHFDPGDRWERGPELDKIVERLREVREQGIRTIVDPCPVECGRDPTLLAEASRAAAVNVVCATGFYVEDIGIPFYWRNRSLDEIATFYLHEIENGIGGTGIKPGVIKAASGDPPTELERRFLAAAAVASERSGLPIITHCENSQGWEVQQEIFAEHGADLRRCLIGHQDQADAGEQLVSIAGKGSFAGIDRVGYELLSPIEKRVELASSVRAAGLLDHLCLSQDRICSLRSARFPYAVPEHLRDGFAQLEPWISEQMTGRPLSYIFTEFWPLLEKEGFTEQDRTTIFEANPARLLSGGE